MAPSAKFVSVNLNKSYGQSSSSASSSSSSSYSSASSFSVNTLTRSRSYGGGSNISHGGVVSLSRQSTRISSPSPSSSSSSAPSPLPRPPSSSSSSSLKLSVPRPVNLPSLRREHAGNDPTISLVASSAGSSHGWTRQNVDESLRHDPSSRSSRSESSRIVDSTKGTISSSSSSSLPIQGQNGGGKEPMVSAYTPPGSRPPLSVVSSSSSSSSSSVMPSTSTSAAGLVSNPTVEKAVVFRGEDFPSLQASVPSSSTSLQIKQQQRDPLLKQQEKPSLLVRNESSKKIHHQEDSPVRESRSSGSESTGIGLRSTESRPDPRGKADDAGSDSRGVKDSRISRAPAPLIKLDHTSNWTDDERETLSSFQPQERSRLELSETYSTVDSWTSDYRDVKRPTSRNGYLGRNDADASGFMPKGGYTKEAGGPGQFANSASRFERDYRGDGDRLDMNAGGRNDYLKRGWSFSAAESTGTRDVRMYPGGANMPRNHMSGSDFTSRDMRQGQEYRSSRDIHGKQGVSVGHGLQGERGGRGSGFPYALPEAPVPRIFNPRQDVVSPDYYARERRSGFREHIRSEDPFLGDIMDARPGSFMGSVGLDVKVSRMKKESLKDENVRDLARESFEAELERVQKMLELESQRAAEEQARAMEIARKEQEEQERIAREEEEMRLKLEEEAREKALRAEREAEEAARRVEEVRRLREEEKRMAALEEERRKEAARKKLLELEERMAKRQEQSLHKVEVRSEEVVQQRKNEVAVKDLPGKSIHGSNKDVQDGDDDGHGEAPAVPSILKLPFGSSHGKEGHGLSTQKSRYTQDWRRENADNGQGAQHAAQQGLTRNTLSRDDVSLSEYDDQRSFKKATRSPTVNWDAQERVPPHNSMDKDVGNWWTKDDPSRFEPPVASYPSEYPQPFGLLRQSLPKQPKVLPPPPRPVMIRKQHFQSDEKETKTESFGISSSASESIPKKDSSAEVAVEVVSHETNQGVEGGDMALKQFENIPSEEVVLSDAVSQFSDDSIEDEQDSTGHAYEDQDSHSDVVSETYTEEVDEISDLTDAQISSEEVEASGDLQTSKEEDPRGNIEFRADGEGNVEEAKAVNQCDKVLVKGEDISVREDGGNQQLVVEDETHEGSVNNGYKGMDKARNSHQERSVSFAPVDMQTNPQTGAVAQKTVQDQVMHHYSHHIPFLSVSTMDASPMAHHSEGLSSRHSLLQQFQQPFSFMALPLPQPTNLNNVPANQSVPSSTQSLQNQQELPFLQLGLLSGVPFMPSAIQIGSIQMPLHIHPQIPQFAQLHGQQQPIFQFGQIGHSGSASHASTILQPGLQIHTTTGQGMLSQDRELQSEHVRETVNEPSNLEQSVKLGADAIVQVQSDKSISTSWSGEHVEDNKIASIPAPQDVKDSSIQEPTAEDMAKPHQAKNRASNSEDAYGVKPAGYVRRDLNAASSRPSRGRRRNDPSFYQGILGRGRGRFRGGRNNRYQGSHVVESWPESGPKRGAQRRIYRRSTQRLEYKVRMPLPTKDGEPSAIEIAEDLTVSCANKEGSGEVENATVANKDSESRPAVVHYNPTQMNVSSGGHPKQAAVKVPSQNNHASNRTLYKKYEVDITEDAPLRSGVVYVFEQRGIETQNDKDDFIEVRSKRQLLREQREQREKENKAKLVDNGVLKTQRSNTKAGAVNSNRSNTKKNVGQGKEVQPAENRSMASHRRAGTDTTGTPAVNIAAHVAPTGGARTRNKPSESNKTTSTKPVGGTSSVSSVATLEASGSGGHQSERRSSEPSLPTAWGGQRSNQEVVSLTQIQLEEAMKPFRLEGHFPDQSHIPDRNPVVPDTGIPRITVSISEKSTVPINVPGSISSLLAGEKIQFGAVTSSPPIPSSSPLSPRSNTQMIELRSEASRVSQFLESDGGTAFSVQEKNGGTHDGFQRKVIDLEAEAEAAASAVAVAAISNEDVVQTHSIRGTGGIDGDGTHPTTPGLRPVGIQASNGGLSESSISVSLPADLLVEMPPPSYQNSTISLPASSGVMLQSLPGGGPPYPCLEMGPMLGGPIFTYGPREDASFASMEPGLSGWQQRHLGTPDSFYGTSPFMNPASLSGIQGHPHMVVYANPFTPVGQFGQLGVGFMGTTYHPSKQPDWTHIPMPSSSSGTLGLNDGEINAGLMASRHANGISNPNAPQQSVTGPCMMPLNAPSVFEAGLSTTFQSHWSKAPAPPVSSMGMSSPMQTGSVVGSTLDRTGQPHLSRVVPNQMGHIAHLMDVSSGFNELPVLKPVARSSYTSSDATPQFPDELGLGETRPTTPSVLNDSSMESSMAVGGSVSKLSRQNRRVSRPPHSVKGGPSVNSRQEPLEALQKHRSIRLGPPAGRTNPPSGASVPFPDARGRTSQQSVAATDNVRTEWVGNSQRRVASGRFSSDKGNTGQPSKVKQIYVPKSANSTSTKLGAISDLEYRV